MGFVVIRRFRDTDSPASSRVYGDEGHAREVARTWASEGWEVDFIASGRRETRTVKVAPPRRLPEKQQQA